MTPLEELRYARSYWAELKARARADVNTFIELVFRNDQEPNAPPFRQQWFHREWQTMWSTADVSVLHGATGFGKTEQKLGHILHRLGNNPSLRIGLAGKKLDGQPLDQMRKLMRTIESNALVLEIFPELEPGAPWNTEGMRLKHAGRDTTTNSVTRYGVDSAVAGARLDLTFLDDVIDEESTANDEQRQKTITWIDASIQTRGTTSGQLHLLANAWHPADAAHVLGARPGVVHRIYPAHGGDALNPDWSRLLWPDFRPRSWLEKKLSFMTPTAYERMFLCRARNEGTRVFLKAWFDAARKRGQGLQPLRTLPRWDDEPTIEDVLMGAYRASRNRTRAVVGVDLATGRKERKKKSDETAVFDLGVDMASGDRRVLWVEAGRWPGAISLEKIEEHESRYHPERFEVEDNGAQDFFVQFAQHFPHSTPRVEGFTTTGQKWDEALGIEGIGVEMKAGRWIIPGPVQLDGDDEATRAKNASLRESYLASLGPPREPGETDADYAARHAAANPEYREAFAQIERWANELLEFSRSGHTPDRVMASYFAKEGALRLASGIFRPLPLALSHGAPHPASPAAEREREIATLGNARNFNPPPAPPPPMPPLPAPPPAPMAPFRVPRA